VRDFQAQFGKNCLWVTVIIFESSTTALSIAYFCACFSFVVVAQTVTWLGEETFLGQ